MLMYGCGLRRSETATLRVQHFNVDTGMLSVQFGKGGTSRTVPLPRKILGKRVVGIALPTNAGALQRNGHSGHVSWWRCGSFDSVGASVRVDSGGSP